MSDQKKKRTVNPKPPVPDAQRRFFRKDELRERWRIGNTKIHDMVHARQIRIVKLGGAALIPASDVFAYEAEIMTSPAEAV